MTETKNPAPQCPYRGRVVLLSVPAGEVAAVQKHPGRLSSRLPGWSNSPEVKEISPDTYPAPRRRGVCVWFTGLSAAGKSTTAEVLTRSLQELGHTVTLLDGDAVRTHLSKGLGFSKEDRDANIRRIGFVAGEVVRHGGIVVCAAVSPYRATRDEVRQMMASGLFVEVFVDTPLEVCEQRDPKGLYAMARRGEIKGLTGIDDPYEPPEHPEVTLNTVDHSPQENAGLLVNYLRRQGCLPENLTVVQLTCNGAEE